MLLQLRKPLPAVVPTLKTTRSNGRKASKEAFDDDPNGKFRACLRGRSVRRWINDPDRLKYPMKRVGKRGEGKFERISWEEAIDTIATKLKETYNNYGPEAVFINLGSGVYSLTGRPFPRLLALTGGYLGAYGTYSAAQSTAAAPYMWGANSALNLRRHPRFRPGGNVRRRSIRHGNGMHRRVQARL